MLPLFTLSSKKSPMARMLYVHVKFQQSQPGHQALLMIRCGTPEQPFISDRDNRVIPDEPKDFLQSRPYKRFATVVKSRWFCHSIQVLAYQHPDHRLNQERYPSIREERILIERPPALREEEGRVYSRTYLLYASTFWARARRDSRYSRSHCPSLPL